MGSQFIKTPLGNEKKLLGCTSGHAEPAGRGSVELVRTFCLPSPWMGFDFLGNAGIGFLASRIAQSTAACGHGKPLAFDV